MKINNLIKVLELIKDLRGDIELYDISEYHGKTYLDFQCNFQPYELTYSIDEIKDCSDESEKKYFMLVNEIYLNEKNVPITSSYCIDENGVIPNS